MNISLITILFGSIVSLLGTMVGALIGSSVKQATKKLLGAIIGFSGGLMLSVVVFELLPEAMNSWSFSGTIVFCILGIIVIMVLDNCFLRQKGTKNIHTKVALMTAIGLMVHNLPEGIIMGCGFAATRSLGLKMSIIIALHDIPEGLAISAPLMVIKVKVRKILAYAFITALPTAIGLWIGLVIGNISHNVLGGCLALASGIMLYVVCDELVPEATALWPGLTTSIGILSGIISGMIITKVI